MTLDPDRWRRARALFEGAAAIGAGERAAWLEARCEGDAELRAEVESLLLHDSEPGAIESAVAGAIRDHDRATASPSRTGTTVGPYRILERIGEGGMGTVWLAERTDGAFEKRVALKVVRGGLDSARLVGRFRTERQILARLDHPGIARILDGGETHDGLPYLVLEHVTGEPLDTHVRARNLSPGAVVDLFLGVCDAVESAHRSLILHRDLKPANILVDASGQTKLLDFGIGKILEESADPGLTGAGGGPMTPEYAAPEQIRGEPVGTATDVYGLGAVLYELIAGEPPFRSTGGTRRSLEAAILERDAERPSRRRPDAGRGAAELDEIVLLALRKDPARRYPTVAALAADLRRWREGRPVTARPPTHLYRARKFVRRNAGAVTAAAAVLVALLAGTVGLAAGLKRAQSAEATARRETETTQEVVDFLIGLFRDSDPNRERGSVTARELLDEGSASIAALEGEPLVMARLLGTMGIAYSELGIYESALDQFGRALAVRERALGSQHPDVAESLNNLANVEKILGRYDDAAAHYERAVAIKEGLSGPRSAEVGRTLYGLAALHFEKGDTRAARELYERTLTIQEEASGVGGLELANTLNALAGIAMQDGDLPTARKQLERSIALAAEELGSEHPRIVGQQTNLAILALEGGDPTRARELCESALPVLERTRGEGHPQVGATLNVLAKAHRDLGDAAGARPLFERSLAVWEGAVGPEHPQVAVALDDLAGLLAETGASAEAARCLDRALAIREKALGPDHPLVAETRERRAAAAGAGAGAGSE